MESKSTSFQSKLFKFLLSFYLRRLTARIWLEDQPDLRFSESDLDLILERTWQEYFRLIGELDKQANLGNWMVMNFAYLTLAAFQVLKDWGLHEQEAINLIYKLTWDVIATWTKRVKGVSK
ncbi:MAG: hypothetical protein HQ574_04450, partial [Chloroflexi bacterium]|nr:hypothetical protein [Chloroflexota bacterium]